MGLSKRYGEVQAVDDLSFAVPAGTTTALLGANGAGKTTTIAMLLGLLEPSSGRITVLGERMPRHRYRVLGRINFSSPYVDLPARLTVHQNLRVYSDLYGIPEPTARLKALAADLDLIPFLDRPTGKLSAGQKTRVMLAKALINEPELLLLDEPTASLDPDTADVMRSYLEHLPTPPARDDAAGLAQHGRGRAPVRQRLDAEGRPSGRPGLPRSTPPTLRPRHPRAGFSGHRTHPRPQPRGKPAAECRGLKAPEKMAQTLPSHGADADHDDGCAPMSPSDPPALSARARLPGTPGSWQSLLQIMTMAARP